jgi:glyoxylate/hydroxypyruvate reductase
MSRTVLLWMDNAALYRDAAVAAGISTPLDFQLLPTNSQPSAEQLANTEMMLTWGVPPGMLARMPRLRWIQTPNTGIANWLTRTDLREDIQLSCGRGIHRVQMPENILGALFHLTKPYTRTLANQREAKWVRQQSIPLAGKTLGVLGMGTIGMELARKAAELEMRVIGTRHSGAPVPHAEKVFRPEGTDEVLAQSDFVVLLLSDTPDTENIINATRLAKMKKSAWLLNFARGNLIVDEDLINAVKTRTIAGAMLDVFRVEPLPAEHPFWRTDGIHVLPHIGGGHPEREKLVAEIFANNLRCYLEGRPQPGLVDRKRGY